jgi:hypothetical protein
MVFTVINTGYPMEVHKAGCRDIAKKARDNHWNIEGEDVTAAVAAEAAHLNSQFDNEYAVEELFEIYPCCGRLKKGK